MIDVELGIDCTIGSSVGERCMLAFESMQPPLLRRKAFAPRLAKDVASTSCLVMRWVMGRAGYRRTEGMASIDAFANLSFDSFRDRTSGPTADIGRQTVPRVARLRSVILSRRSALAQWLLLTHPGVRGWLSRAPPSITFEE